MILRYLLASLARNNAPQSPRPQPATPAERGTAIARPRGSLCEGEEITRHNPTGENAMQLTKEQIATQLSANGATYERRPRNSHPDTPWEGITATILADVIENWYITAQRIIDGLRAGDSIYTLTFEYRRTRGNR